MRLVVRVLGIEVLAIEQGDEPLEIEADWSDAGTITSVGFQPNPPDNWQRPEYDE